MATQRFVVNVEAAVFREGAYLLATRAAGEDHAAGQRALIGGTVDADPTPEEPLAQTVEREVHEEVGVEVADLTYVTSGAFESDDGDPVVNVVFLGRWTAGEPRIREPEEVSAVEWLPVEDLTEVSLPPWTRGYLQAADARRRELGW
jgi:8-oxo-dGTP diphosphatase